MAYTIKWHHFMAEVAQEAWDELVSPADTPFLEWDWLHQLEASGSITPKTGWQPQHLTVWSGRQLVAAAPLYLKRHSMGEFVFDSVWADVAHGFGIDYYPKLVGMSPVTPVPGYRFLVAPGADGGKIRDLMFLEIDRFCRQQRLAGCSFLYVDPGAVDTFARSGFSPWVHQSFRWENRKYHGFEDYLDAFNAKQRHNIRSERRRLDSLGVCITTHTGDDIPAPLMRLMYHYYERTNDKFGPWGCKFLTPSFFTGIHRRFRHRLLLTAALAGDSRQLPAGMALLLYKGDQLYGRYWGSAGHLGMLHFNTCYYAPIQWAIANGIRAFDPGIGSNHKIRRGFRAIPNFSLHRFYDPRLQYVWDRYIGEINRGELDNIEALNAHLPFVNGSKR